MRERRPRSSASPGRQDPNESTPTVGGTLPARQSEPVPLAILSVQVLPQLHVILGTETGADAEHSLCALHILSISRLSSWRMHHSARLCSTRLRQAMAGHEAPSL